MNFLQLCYDYLYIEDSTDQIGTKKSEMSLETKKCETWSEGLRFGQGFLSVIYGLLHSRVCYRLLWHGHVRQHTRQTLSNVRCSGWSLWKGKTHFNTIVTNYVATFALRTDQLKCEGTTNDIALPYGKITYSWNSWQFNPDAKQKSHVAYYEAYDAFFQDKKQFVKICW